MFRQVPASVPASYCLCPGRAGLRHLNNDDHHQGLIEFSTALKLILPFVLAALKDSEQDLIARRIIYTKKEKCKSFKEEQSRLLQASGNYMGKLSGTLAYTQASIGYDHLANNLH